MRAGFTMRRALRADLDGVMAILGARERWLREDQNSDQWTGTHQWTLLVQHLIRHGNVWVLEEQQSGSVVGTVTVSTDPDFDFWTPAEHRRPALYLSKLATAPGWSGRELGQEMLDWAVEHAGRTGARVVRLDTWRTSLELQKYYERRGWTYVRTVKLDHRQSGALFEHAASPRFMPWRSEDRRDPQPLAASMLSPRSMPAAGA